MFESWVANLALLLALVVGAWIIVALVVALAVFEPGSLVLFAILATAFAIWDKVRS